MEDDNLAALLNTSKYEVTTPVQQKQREPLVELADNDDQDSIVSMTCLNDQIPPSSTKRHFDGIKLVQPSSVISQGSRSKKPDTLTNYPPHLISSGNRNSTDNLIQSSIDVTLSSNSSPDGRRHRPLAPASDEIPFVTIVGAEDCLERENESPKNKNIANPLSTPTAVSRATLPSQVHSTPDVQISRFDKDPATSKAAFARSQLAKRLSQNQGQQRSIPVQSISNTTNSDSSSRSGQHEQTATTLAATVAASVAVSVAQPILKLQNEFEQRMNSVLEQIQQKQKAQTNGTVIPVTHVQTTSDPTRSITNSVDTRIKTMEKIQHEQQQAITQLADLVQTRRPKSKSPAQQHKVSFLDSSPPSSSAQRHFLDTLVDTSSPPVRLAKPHKKHHAHKKSTASPTSNKRPSRVTSATGRTGKSRSPVLFKEQPPNSHFNIEPSSPFACSTCDRSKSRSHSRSRSPAKSLSPESSYPRTVVPIPRPPSIMSDGFIPSSTSTLPGNALREVYPPFDKYLNNSIPPEPLEPKPMPAVRDNIDLHERIKQIDEAKQLLDDNYAALQRRQTDTTTAKQDPNDSLRIKRLVEQCVKQVTKQVREEVKNKLEQDELEQEQAKKYINPKKRPTSKTQLAFDRHSTIPSGKQTTSTNESSGPTKPYSDAFMESVYGRTLYEKIKKEGKQPYFKLRTQANIRPKQPKQIEQIPVKDIGLKPTSPATISHRCVIQQPYSGPPPPPPPVPVPPPVYEPEYQTRPGGAILLGPPQIRDTRTFQPVYVPPRPQGPKLTTYILPNNNIDPSSQKKVHFGGNKNESIRTDIDDDENKDDDDGQGIELPGYHRPKESDQPPYEGPRFPPTIPHDEGYRNRQYDTLQSGAVDWLEQELIARFMSQLQNQHTTVPIRQHRDIITAHSSESSTSDDQSIHDRLLDLLGQDGFQFFVNMGQPIDQDLIQALTREVLEEHIAQMIGFHSPRESIHVLQPPAPPPRVTTPTIPTTATIDHGQCPQEQSVPTPLPTPPQSPPPSKHHPRVVTPEITGLEITTDTDSTTPRSATPVENIDRPLPSVIHHSIDTPSASPSPPPTPRIQPSTPIIEKHDKGTMASIEISKPPSPPKTPPLKVTPVKPRLPSPVSTPSTTTTSSPSSSTTTYSIPYSGSDSPFSDHMWFDDRSEGQIDLPNGDRPQTEGIMRHVQRLLKQPSNRYSSVTPADMSFNSPPYSPAGATHTLSIGEVPPDFPKPSYPINQDNDHTTPTESDESNHSGRSEGESSHNNQQPRPIDIKYKRPSQGYLKKKPNGK